MELDSARKAAMLLAWLGPETAAELLKEAQPATVTRLAAEMATLDASTPVETASRDYAREFCAVLRGGSDQKVRGEALVKAVLETVVGRQRMAEMMTQIQQMLFTRDPFRVIRSAGAVDIANALKGEGAQVASLVLSELPPKKSAEVLSLLDEKIQDGAIRTMAGGEEVSSEARLRVANVVMARLRGESGPTGDRKRHERLRRVALVLRGMPRGSRDTLLQSITQNDTQAGKDVRDLMVVWEDLPNVSGRAIQAALRSVDSRKLALALFEADQETIGKIRGNISARMSAMVDEEASLLSTPNMEDIADAREPILDALREMNNEGQLSFEDDEDA